MKRLTTKARKHDTCTALRPAQCRREKHLEAKAQRKKRFTTKTRKHEDII
jgi:hypothetical protein